VLSRVTQVGGAAGKEDLVYSRAAPHLALSIVTLVALAGCTGLPTGPEATTDDPGSTQQPPNEEPRFLEEPGAYGGLSGSSGGDPVTEPLIGSAQIQGKDGGTLTTGRFTVIVPPGAYNGKSEISITVPDPKQLIVELEISPASANNFKVPVQLIADCKGLVSATELDEVTILWFDEETEKWYEPSDPIRDHQEKTVQMGLSHFSTYGVVMGRSGW
jgi:hypothetical protein